MFKVMKIYFYIYVMHSQRFVYLVVLLLKISLILGCYSRQIIMILYSLLFLFQNSSMFAQISFVSHQTASLPLDVFCCCLISRIICRKRERQLRPVTWCATSRQTRPSYPWRWTTRVSWPRSWSRQTLEPLRQDFQQRSYSLFCQLHLGRSES